MKKIILLTVILSIIILPVNISAEQNNDAITINSKSAVLIDSASGNILFEKDAEKLLPIASITKVMTLNLVFDAIENGNLDLNEKITISQNASSMGGSQVFLDAGYDYLCSDLIKSVIIASANDSAVALAERVAGSEETFVVKMNKKAQELGMTNTVFKNCTGLFEEGHLSTAKDVALMSRELLKHNDYFTWSTTWMDSIHHDKDGRNSELVNTNKLIRSLAGCDGLKTGYTSEAGFCVTTTCMRDNMRLISVILGGSTGKERFEESAKLINYGFANFENKIIVAPGETICEVNVQNGKNQINAVSENSFSICTKNDEEENFEKQINLIENISAPVKIGEQVGTLNILKDGNKIGEIPLIASDNCAKMNFTDKIKKIFSLGK